MDMQGNIMIVRVREGYVGGGVSVETMSCRCQRERRERESEYHIGLSLCRRRCTIERDGSE